MVINVEILFIWLVWGFIFAGMGATVFYSVGLTGVHFFDCFWAGWASSLFFLEIWHSFLPINIGTFLICSLIGLFGWIRNRDLLGLDRIKSRGEIYLFLLFSIIVAFWLALRLWSPIILYDDPLYYLQQVLWAKTFPIIPGLANLYNRLGFYDVFFLYTAMLDSLPPIPGYKLSASLLMVILLTQSIWGVVRAVRDHAAGGLRNIFFAILFVPVFIKAGTPCTVNIPATDTAVFILTIIVFGYFLDFSVCRLQNEGTAPFIFLITILSTAGIIMKGSFLFVGVWLLAITYMLWFFKSSPSPEERRIVIAGISMAGVAGLLPFVLRNIIVSGYALYPFPYLSVPFDWRVPFAKSSSTFNWVLSWSRAPKIDWQIVLKDSAWVIPWAKYMMKQWMEIVLPGIIFLMAGAAIIVRALFLKASRPDLKIWAIFSGAAGMCLVSWFLSAPDIRFMGSQLLVLAAGSTAILLISLQPRRLFWWMGWMLIGIFMVLRLNFPAMMVLSAHRYLSDSRNFYQPRKIELKTFKTDSGLVIYTPVKGEFCWDVEILCTPYPDAKLMLRNPDDIHYGFKTAANLP